VDVARGAQVSILPLQVDDEVDIADTVKKLALGTIQHFPRFSGSDSQYKKLVKNIQTLTERTTTTPEDSYQSTRSAVAA